MLQTLFPTRRIRVKVHEARGRLVGQVQRAARVGTWYHGSSQPRVAEFKSENFHSSIGNPFRDNLLTLTRRSSPRQTPTTTPLGKCKVESLHDSSPVLRPGAQTQRSSHLRRLVSRPRSRWNALSSARQTGYDASDMGLHERVGGTGSVC